MVSEHFVNIMRRAYDVSSMAKDEPEQGAVVHGFAILLFLVTAVVTVGGIILFDYAFQVVKILTIVEDIPNDYDLATTSVTAEEDEDGPPKVARGLYLGGTPNIEDKYITSSFRKTLAYLREEAGIFSPWRGFSVNIAYVVSASVMNGILKVPFEFPVGKYIAGCLVLLIVSPLSLIHTHVILAPPTKETWFGRLARTPYRSIVHTLPAVLLLAVAGQATYAFPTLLLKAFLGNQSFEKPAPHDRVYDKTALTPLQCLALYSVFIASHVLLFIPAMITLFRVQASVYPADEDSIIPFERRGPLNPVEAWKTYTWEGKRRLIRLYAKVLPLVWIVSIAMGTMLWFEAGWVLGENKVVMDRILQVWLGNQSRRAE